MNLAHTVIYLNVLKKFFLATMFSFFHILYPPDTSDFDLVSLNKI